MKREKFVILYEEGLAEYIKYKIFSACAIPCKLTIKARLVKSLYMCKRTGIICFK